MSYSAAVSPVIVVSYSGKGSSLNEDEEVRGRRRQIPETQVGAMGGQEKSSTQVKVSVMVGGASVVEFRADVVDFGLLVVVLLLGFGFCVLGFGFCVLGFGFGFCFGFCFLPFLPNSLDSLPNLNR